MACKLCQVNHGVDSVKCGMSVSGGGAMRSGLVD